MRTLPILLICLGIASAIISIVLNITCPLYQFYPVNTYQAELTVTGDSVSAPREQEPPKTYPLQPSISPIEGKFKVRAEVQVERPLPLRGRESLDPNYAQPTQDQIDAAGPERAVVIQLTSSRDLSFLVWPPPAATSLPANFPMSQGVLPNNVVQAILPALAEEIVRMSGDPSLAQPVAAGGAPRPTLQYGHASRLELPLRLTGALLFGLGAAIISLRVQKCRASPKGDADTL